MQTSALFHKNYHSAAQVTVNQGGTSSGKTYAILQVLFVLAAAEKVVITVVGQDMPNLKAGALRDALAIQQSVTALGQQIISYHKTDRVYHFNNGSGGPVTTGIGSSENQKTLIPYTPL